MLNSALRNKAVLDITFRKTCLKVSCLLANLKFFLLTNLTNTAAAAAPAAAPTTVATGALLDLGEDIPAPPDRQQHQPTHVAVEGQGKPQGRDPNQSANVMEEPSRKGK